MIKKHTNKNLLNKKPWIKICGLTEIENALECAQLGADAIGFVFFEKSPRNISVKKAGQISNALPDHIITIGVFVDESFEFIMERVKFCGLKGVQLHGNETPELVNKLLCENLIVIKALFAEKKPFLNQASKYGMSHFLLVEYGKGTLPGGNAEAWNYELALGLKTKTPVILAGGLNCDNISQAISTVTPAGIDVSSGVEKTYGIKDLKKVQLFIQKIKSTPYY